LVAQRFSFALRHRLVVAMSKKVQGEITPMPSVLGTVLVSAPFLPVYADVGGARVQCGMHQMCDTGSLSMLDDQDGQNCRPDGLTAVALEAQE
jgi:hypothetical protein